MNGKGSKPRPYKGDLYRSNYDAIFGGQRLRLIRKNKVKAESSPSLPSYEDSEWKKFLDESEANAFPARPKMRRTCDNSRFKK